MNKAWANPPVYNEIHRQLKRYSQTMQQMAQHDSAKQDQKECWVSENNLGFIGLTVL